MDRLPPRNNRKCSVEGCENRGDIRKGLCNLHYRRWKRHGDPLGGGASLSRVTYAPLVTDGSKCTIVGCDRVVKALGYCSAHYGRFRKYGDPLGGGAFRKPWSKQVGIQCCIDSCDRSSVTKGMCSAHYARFVRLGSAVSLGPVIRRQNLGGKKIDRNGYVFWRDATHPLATRNGSVAEHRVVMSEFLERPLRKNENIHHKNGNRSDNRIENLELWVTSQPSGQRPTDLLKWAREIIATYGDEESKLAQLEYRNLT